MQHTNATDLSPKFVKTITEMFGEHGKQWLTKLPSIVAEISIEWELNVDVPFANLSYHYVANCIQADGSEAVLKIGFPEEALEFANEVKMLHLYDGAGAINVFRSDETRYAMLLEKVSPGIGLGEMVLGESERTVSIAIDILKQIERPASKQSNGFHLLSDWIGVLRKAGVTEFAESAGKTLKFFDELSQDEKYLLHGDFHHENILSATREPFLVIDPKGLIGGIGYDIGVFLNNHRDWLDGEADQTEKLGQAAEQFAQAFELTTDDIKRWAYIQAILSAWWTFEENGESAFTELNKADIWGV
jgi:streptomycin 6-kinase